MNRLLLPAPATKQEPLTEETAPELDTAGSLAYPGLGCTASARAPSLPRAPAALIAKHCFRQGPKPPPGTNR